MSIESPFNTAGATRAHGKRPVVLRFAELFPHQVRRYQLHNDRKQRDMDQVDPARTHLNRKLIGAEDWFETLPADIRLASLENVNQEVEGLQRANRIGEAQKRLLEGPRDPWRKSKGGPLREFVITAHRDWFETPSESNMLFDVADQEAREQQFEAMALAWLKSRFGDQVIHARADRDETTFHIHGIIAPWTEKTSKRSGRQRLLQPSSHPLLKDYEKAQDDIGAFFADLGLVRGKRRAEERREAKAAKETDPSVDVPEPRAHVPAHIWRADEEVRLRRRALRLRKYATVIKATRARAAQRQKEAEAQKAKARAAEHEARLRKRDADEVLQIAEHVAEGHLVPSPEGRMKVSRDLPEGSGVRRRLERLLAQPTVSGRQLMRHLGRAYRAFGRVATGRAEEEVSARLSAIEQGATAVAALRAKMLAVLPDSLRKSFMTDTLTEVREADRAIKALKKSTESGGKNNER